MTTTYTNAQIEAAIKSVRFIANDMTFQEPNLFKAADMLRTWLTERQAGSSGDVSVDTVACRDITCIAGCFDAALLEGWEEALIEGDMDRIQDLWGRRISFALDRAMASIGKRPQPPTKESVRGVTDEEAKAALQAYDDQSMQHNDARYVCMRAALTKFTESRDGKYLAQRGEEL